MNHDLTLLLFFAIIISASLLFADFWSIHRTGIAKRMKKLQSPSAVSNNHSGDKEVLPDENHPADFQEDLFLSREKDIVPKLSPEQENFIELALQGNNILVDACIGSGKTFSIWHLCNQYASLYPDRHILYLTYNRLLKTEARDKIRLDQVEVTNYHGFAYKCLDRINMHCGRSDLLLTFSEKKPPIDHYDLLVIDEYQDIDSEIAKMLTMIKGVNSDLQIVAVGDMEQKIYDRSSLDVKTFIESYLDDYTKLSFTYCYRLSSTHAAFCGRVWKKEIKGVNDRCIVQHMGFDDVVSFLSKQECSDILCLGRRGGLMTRVLNELESLLPEKFNKKTVYASIRERDEVSVEPTSESAIFTTFDSCKGLERKFCVVFDFTESYWELRSGGVDYEILRNIFLVAASRGKEKIIFVTAYENPLSENRLSTPYAAKKIPDGQVSISEMFDFKYAEDVEECYRCLTIKESSAVQDHSVITVSGCDGLIDLTPCIGNFVEVSYFNRFSIDIAIEFYLKFHKNLLGRYSELEKSAPDEYKVLLLTAMETKQDRYASQVSVPYVGEDTRNQIHNRLSKYLSRDEKVQQKCQIFFSQNDGGVVEFSAVGLADVVKAGVVYELKFVHELQHKHFLQCACYMVSLGLEKGLLWNLRNNAMYEITVPDKKSFLDAVTVAVTKHAIGKYHEPVGFANGIEQVRYLTSKMDCEKIKTSNKIGLDLQINGNLDIKESGKELLQDSTASIFSKHAVGSDIEGKFSVIDTETSFDNKVISIGIVISRWDDFMVTDSAYYLIDPEYTKPGLYSSVLYIKGADKPKVLQYKEAILEIDNFLHSHLITNIFAYNAVFDKNHLPELHTYNWYDIMRLAAYRDYNSNLPDDALYCKTGRLKTGYGVSDMLRYFTGDDSCNEVHNALLDAKDELFIMKSLGHSLDKYSIAKI